MALLPNFYKILEKSHEQLTCILCGIKQSNLPRTVWIPLGTLVHLLNIVKVAKNKKEIFNCNFLLFTSTCEVPIP